MNRMKFSHADYMAQQIHKLLVILRTEYPVKMLADMMGGSASLLYSWSDSADDAKAKYILALASGLAEIGDYRMINIILPVGDKIWSEKNQELANGSVLDELADGVNALDRSTLAHRGHNPDEIAGARKLLRQVEQRLEQEEMLLRQQIDSPQA